jgi:hypothetical protein
MLQASKFIDQSAELARNRRPTTPEEWQVYFGFYIYHLEDTLQGEMMEKLEKHRYTNTQDFWHGVFDIMLPISSLSVILGSTLYYYMPWAEAKGLDLCEDSGLDSSRP